ncbi:hypothetical protein SMACR_04296 [Sordaria macrospora]|uniref:WGS project CABT00000000 data, contig 2.19 n=2 Tax=Sordaria macrospora TaxID=5147 RepID=F7W1F4_SORMK|nr:uncharacterized protein SMAC_04296 [Sordaria macrospora k-hell]KAA8635794.1 hypothetical protein SMACR_04296 [Sordaria macrospora]KAH7626464.1 hypothetical protein B0T09DRAFT_271366 [Sordaria sp. MPI-SDFR-AT-0083]CCC04929.1 unnamed protein product [Sordaria macrospora k-hell]
MHNSSKKEFSLLGAFLMELLWLLSTLTLRAIELLDSTLLGPAQKVIVNYVSCATQTSDDDFPTWTMLEFLSDGLNHLAEFFNAGLKSVTSPFEGNILTTLTHSLVALPSTPVRKQCSPTYQQKSTSPSILDCSDDDAA